MSVIVPRLVLRLKRYKPDLFPALRRFKLNLLSTSRKFWIKSADTADSYLIHLFFLSCLSGKSSISFVLTDHMVLCGENSVSPVDTVS